MVRPLCAVRDSAVGAYQPPFVSHSVGSAVRSFGDAVRNPESGMDKHPDDYELYHVGNFDEVSGVVSPIDLVLIARAKDYASFSKEAGS